MKRTIKIVRMVGGGVGLLFALALLLHLAAAASAKSAATRHRQGTIPPTAIVLMPTKDNTLYESTLGNLSNGAGTNFFVGKTGGGSARRGLLAFAIADKLPAGATILSATLELQMSKTSGGAAEIGLHRLVADWGESSSDADANEGRGGDAATGDATWLHTFHDTALWQTPGGDFVPTATVTTTVNGVGRYTWDSSPTLVAELQDWLDNPATDFGWILLGDESASSTSKRFSSREATSAANRPQLTIMYTVSETVSNNIYLPLIQR